MEDRVQARSAGFDHHLVKPLDFQRLREILALRSQPLTEFDTAQ
jgi:hypothetical protein